MSPHASIDQVTASEIAAHEPSSVVTNSTALGGALKGNFPSPTLRDVISVKDFGAVGNGVHIDGPAIQEACAAGAASFNGGNFVLVTSGTYLTEHEINPEGACTITGTNPVGKEGPVAIIKMAKGANLDAVIASPNWSNNSIATVPQVNFRWLGVDGNKTEQTGGEGHGIVVSCYRGSVVECSIWRPRGDGIRVTSVMKDGTTQLSQDTPECKCLRNVVYNMGKHGISVIEGSTAGIMTDGFMMENVCYTEEATSHEGDGIHMMQTGGWLVCGNHCYGIGHTNMSCTACSEARIMDNYLDGWGAKAAAGTVYGLFIAKAEGGVIISGNSGSMLNHTIGAENTVIGLCIESASTGAMHAAMTANIFVGPGTEGTGLRVIQNGTAELHLAKPPNSNQFMKWGTNTNVDATVLGTNDPRPEPGILTASESTYTVPATVTALRIIGKGNSGGGGQGGGGFTTTHAGGGAGGGGAGGVVEQIVTGVKPGTVLTAKELVAAKGGEAAGVGGAAPTAGSPGESGKSTTLTGTNGFATITALGGGGGAGGGGATSGAAGASGTCGNYGSPGNGSNSNVIGAAGVGGQGGSGDANASGTHAGAPMGMVSSGGGGGASGGTTENGNGGTGGSAQGVGQGGAAGAGAAAATAGTNGGGGAGGGGGAVNKNGSPGAAGSIGSWTIIPL